MEGGCWSKGLPSGEGEKLDEVHLFSPLGGEMGEGIMDYSSV